jgi:hypothetical protein
LLEAGFAAEVDTGQLAGVWREEDERRFTLVITDEGRAALGLADDDGHSEGPGCEVDNTKPAAKPKSARSGSKRALLLEMLQREGGASLDELVGATAWLPHTTRAAITGVRKHHEVTKEKVDGVARYSISGAAQ